MNQGQQTFTGERKQRSGEHGGGKQGDRSQCEGHAANAPSAERRFLFDSGKLTNPHRQSRQSEENELAGLCQEQERRRDEEEERKSRDPTMQRRSRKVDGRPQ